MAPLCFQLEPALSIRTDLLNDRILFSLLSAFAKHKNTTRLLNPLYVPLPLLRDLSKLSHPPNCAVRAAAPETSALAMDFLVDLSQPGFTDSHRLFQQFWALSVGLDYKHEKGEGLQNGLQHSTARQKS